MTGGASYSIMVSQVTQSWCWQACALLTQPDQSYLPVHPGQLPLVVAYAADSVCVPSANKTASTLQDVRYQMHDEAEDQRLFKLAQEQLMQLEKRQLQGQAVLPLLQNSVINQACNDPAAFLGPQLILPTLRKRLLARAREFHQAEATRDLVQVAVVQHTGATLLHASLYGTQPQQLHEINAQALSCQPDSLLFDTKPALCISERCRLEAWL